MLEGSLHDFSLPDVLRLLAFTSKSGRLVLSDGERRARVELLDGRVRDASADARRLPLARRVLGAGLVEVDALTAALDAHDHLPTDLELARWLASRTELDSSALSDLVREQTVDATFDLLRWETGNFRFDGPGGDAARGPSALDLLLGVDELLEETSRRLDAWPALVERTGPHDGVVSIRRPGREHAEVALPPDGWTLLGLVDGRRTLADLVDLCGQGEYRTRRALGALVDEGVIAVGAGDGIGPGERLLRDHARLAAKESALRGDEAPTAPVPEVAEVAEPTTIVAEIPAAAPAAPADAPTEAPAASAEPVEDAPATPSLAERLAAGARELAGADDAAPTEGEPTTDRSRRPLGEAVPRASDGTPRRLRARVRDERLRTDPSVDEELVSRLIAGVEGL